MSRQTHKAPLFRFTEDVETNFHICDSLLAAVQDDENYDGKYRRSVLKLRLFRRRLIRFTEAVGIFLAKTPGGL